MRKYLYAEGKEPMIVDECQEIDGWHDSPLAFVKTTDFGINPDETVKVQCLGESIEGVVEYCNGMLNLELMNFKSLREFAKKHCRDIKARSKKALIDKIRRHNGNSSGHNQGCA